MIRQPKIRETTVYPEDILEKNPDTADVIGPDQAKTLPALFQERVHRSPWNPAYTQFDPSQQCWVDCSWQEMSDEVQRWRKAFSRDGLKPGECVAVRASNSTQWIMYDQSAMAQGAVVVPVFRDDRADNIAYILEHTRSQFLLVEEYSQWVEMEAERERLAQMRRVIVIRDPDDQLKDCSDERVEALDAWLEKGEGEELVTPEIHPGDLATIVYTSGTTGRPKGVMLSHRNILSNAYSSLQSVIAYPSDRFLSFLPLSHMFERTAGYYLTMMAGSRVAFNRSIAELMNDIAEIRPTVLILVPRIFDKAYARIKAQLDEGPAVKKWLFGLAVSVGWQRFEYRQKRASWHPKQLLWLVLNRLVAQKVVGRFGGELRFAISGGARLAPTISRVFIGLGIDILQGYGLTETSPVLAVNTLTRNDPSTVGLPFRGVQLRLGENDELLAKGPGIMMGYWKDPDATAACIDPDGWLSTGDKARISSSGYISISGRIKEIIVLSNGEKIPPADLEAAICDDLLFEQAMVVGEDRPYLVAVVVLNAEFWPETAGRLEVDAETDLNSEVVRNFAKDKIAELITGFPGYAYIREVVLTLEEWQVDNGMITPTLKLKRPVLIEHFKSEIEELYTET